MPTRATTNKSAGSGPAGKPPRSGGPGKPAANPGQARDPGVEESPSAKVRPVAAKAVSLIGDDDSPGDAATGVAAPPAQAAPRRMGEILPPISRIQSGTEEPLAPVAAAPPAPVETPEEGLIGDKVIHMKAPIALKDLATHLNVKPYQLIGDLMEMEIFASLGQTVDADVAARLCEKHGFIFEREKRQKGEGVHKQEAVVAPPSKTAAPPEEDLVPRAPIVTFMGHVDHGKTSLLDYIRKSRVAAREAGGITQHIGAYTVKHQGRSITFLDTPGHEAFTAMRSRGANVTDIAVIVIAADDGIMPQTIEALNHAKAAEVKIVIAINKVDLPGANIDRVKKQLQDKGFATEDWGGEIVSCEVSATKGTGMDHLLEMILLETDMLELKCSRKAPPRGTVIEAQIEPGMGPIGTVIVQVGVLKVGQAFICGNQWGKLKSLLDDQGKRITEAGPSTPVRVVGFNGLPSAGDEFVAMDSERDARTISEERLQDLRNRTLTKPQRATLETLMQGVGAKEVKNLRIVLKSDVQGSLEAIVQALGKIESEKVKLEFLHSGVGPVSESDVLLTSASDAIIVGFGVKVDNGAIKAAKREGVQIKLYSIIYELVDQIREAMAGLLDPESRESVIGHAEVKQVFELSKGIVAGCLVTDGRISRAARARVVRGKQPVYDGPIGTLRRFQDEVKEVRSGLECGIKLGNFNEYQPGDVIECYVLEKVEQKL